MQRLDLESFASKLAARLPRVVAGIHDAKPINKSLVKVVATFSTLDVDANQLQMALAKLFGEAASAIPGSFRPLRGSKTPAAVGFITANTVIVDYDEKVVAKMKVMASNLLMDSADESMWEIRSSGPAKYLARVQNEDLAELVQLANVKAFHVPMLNRVALASISSSEFVGYIDTINNEMKYGFVVKAGDESIDVLPLGEDEAETIENDLIVESAHLNGADQELAAKAGIGQPSNASDKASLVEYYKELYAYDPDYMKQMVAIIEGHAAL